MVECRVKAKLTPMSSVLLVTHDSLEAERAAVLAGSVGEAFAGSGFDLVTATARVDLPDPDTFDAVVLLGSSASATDDRMPWLVHEMRFVERCAELSTPMMGICFGAQVMARVLGGSVSRAPRPEIGWTSVHSAAPHRVAGGEWFQFHYDRFTPPHGADILAVTNRACQAFGFGPHLGVQFHPEITPAAFELWRTEWERTGYERELAAAGHPVGPMASEIYRREPTNRERAHVLVERFILGAGMAPKV